LVNTFEKYPEKRPTPPSFTRGTGDELALGTKLVPLAKLYCRIVQRIWELSGDDVGEVAFFLGSSFHMTWFFTFTIPFSIVLF
jgi:hypothetical protein